MSDKKHIDDLFKEQLQNFEAAPSPQVWNNIQAQLKKEKDDRKVIPLWWKLGGVAAVIALLLTVGNYFYNPSGASQGDTLVNEDVKTVQEHPTTTNSELTTKDANTQNTSEEDTQEEMTPQLEVKEQLLKETNLNQEGLVSEKNTTQQQDKYRKQSIDNTLKQRDAIASENLKKSNSESTYNNKAPFKEPIKDEVITTTIASDNTPNKREEELQNPLFKDKKVDSQETGVVISEEQKNTTDRDDPTQQSKEDKNPLIKDATEVGISNTTESGVTQSQETIQEENKEEDKPSIFDAIAEGEETEEDKKENVQDVDLRSWEVTPNFGPVFYSSLDGGSSIDPMFKDNSQSTDTNFSYGVQVSYAVNDRLSIRSGVSNVNLGYTTGDIDLATGPVDAALTSIDYGGRTNVLTAVDKGALATTDSANPFDDLSPKSTGGNNAQLSQNLTYYEVPLELNYALVDNRFGINMIGGFSTLFLGDSEVVANDGDFREVLGESNNLNSVSFSTNVGLGFNYKISKRLKFNIEPMFKYQLNPYSDSSVDFKPYYLGVYSGLSFKF